MTNLLPIFNGEYYHYQDNSGVKDNMAIPKGYVFWFREATKDFADQTTEWGQPEAVVWGRESAPTEPKKWLKGQPLVIEQEKLFDDYGFPYILKIFGAWRSIWWTLSAKIPTVIGKRYKIDIPVFPDLVLDYDSEGYKVVATDPISGEYRLVVNGTPDNDWVTALPMLAYTTLHKEFTAVGNESTVTLEIRARHGLDNNGFFIGQPVAALIEEIDTPSDDIPPTDTPVDVSNQPDIDFGILSPDAYVHAAGLNLFSAWAQSSEGITPVQKAAFRMVEAITARMLEGGHS